MNIQNFNTHIATVYGVNQAIFIQSMVQFTFINASEERNLHDNRYWCYGTPKFFAKYFPYFKPRLIKEIINKCVKDGLLIVGNYNRVKYDRTNWYALSNKALIELNLDITCHKPLNLTIGRNPSNQLDDSCPIDWTEDVSPIPIQNNKETIQNTYVDFQSTGESEGDQITENPPSCYQDDLLFMQFYSIYPNKQKPELARKAFYKHKPDKEFVSMLCTDVKARVENNWKNRHKSKIPHPTTYLNAKEWEGEIYASESDSSTKTKRFDMDELTAGIL